MHATRIVLVVLSLLALFDASPARSQYIYYPNKLVVVPSIPIANSGSGQFTVIVPLEAVRYFDDTIVQPNVSPVVTTTYNDSPPFGGVIDIRIAYSTSAIVVTGQTYDATGVPILVTVRSPGQYIINYYTKSTTIPDDPYALRLSGAVSVIAPSNTNKFTLENPQPGSYQSGIGVISGWACLPNNLSVSIDSGPPIPVPGGGGRADTAGTCGHAGTGFGLLVNYNNLKAGRHTIRLASSDPSYVSDMASFNVTLPGDLAPFLSGISKEVSIPGFPFTGLSTTLIWQQSLQNFSIKSTQ